MSRRGHSDLVDIAARPLLVSTESRDAVHMWQQRPLRGAQARAFPAFLDTMGR